MTQSIRILGIYPISAKEPCHLLEIEVHSPTQTIDFDMITQEISELPQSSWQAAYDEQQLENDPSGLRWLFFFHYLDFDLPLMTQFGPLDLPKPTPLPMHLKNIEYIAP